MVLIISPQQGIYLPSEQHSYFSGLHWNAETWLYW